MEDETILNIKSNNGAFEIRYCFKGDKPYFMANDVVKCFGGYSSPSTLTKLRVSPDNILKKDVYLGQGGSRKCLFIDEKGVYSLVQHPGFSAETRRMFVFWFKDIPLKLMDMMKNPDTETVPEPETKANEPATQKVTATPFDIKMMKIGMDWCDFVLDTLKKSESSVASEKELEIALKVTEMLLENY